MSDHDSDADNVPPTKSHKSRKTKYVDASDVEKKVKSDKKKQVDSDDEAEEKEAPPPKSSMSDAEEEDSPQEEEPGSLLDDDDDDAMVAAMEKQEKKALKKKTKVKQEEQPSKKQRVNAKSKSSSPPSDSESEEEEKEAPSYNAFDKKKQKKPAAQNSPKKKKRKHDNSDSDEDEEARTKREDEEQRSDKSDTESGNDEPAAAASSSSSSARKFPFESNPMDPNYTVRKWSEKNGLYVHYSQLVPADNFTVTESKNDGYAKAFFSVKCNKEQQFDFNAGSTFKKYKFGETVVVGAFGKTSYPRMWPYGDRFPLKYSKFPPPQFNSGIKLKLPLYNNRYANNLTQEKKGVGLVDPSADHFMQNWCRLLFDKWAKEQSWKWSQKMFKTRRSKLFKPIDDRHKVDEAAYNNSQEEWASYESSLKEYEKALHDWGKVKKNRDPKPEKPEKPSDPRIKKKPNTSDAKKESELQAVFMREGVKGVVLTGENDKFEHVTFAAPLLRNLTVKERDGNPALGVKPLVPNLPKDPFFIGAFKTPPMYKKANSDVLEPGYPMIPVDVPMWRCVTAEEAIHDKKRGFKNPSPHRLIALENRFIVSGDVIAPVFQFDHMDSETGSGFRFKLLAVIWLGESGKLKDEQKPLPWDPATKEGYDPATYYCMAQPYMRKKGTFDPDTVENSKYESARTNDQQMVEIAPDPDSLYGEYN